MNLVELEAPVLRKSPVRRMSSERWAFVLLAAVLTATAFHRLFLLVSTGFPLNDGGLFYVFVEAISKTFPLLPEAVSYNGLDLPFAYPPLSFWLAAMLTHLGIDTLSIFHVLPIVMNIGLVLLFALLLHRSNRSLLVTALAVLFFATMQRSFEWLVMGGGLSRGLGSIFLVATLIAIEAASNGPRKHLPTRRMVVAGVFVGGAILSHLEWGLDAAASVVLSRALRSPSVKEYVVGLLIAGFTSLLIILPWLVFVYSAHGLEPFLSAGGSSHWGIEEFTNQLLVLGVWSLIFPMMPIGAVILWRRREFFWIGFLLICLSVTPRHSATPVSLPLAVFAAYGTLWFYQRLSSGGRNKKVAFAVVGMFVFIVIGTRFNRDYLARGWALHSLTRDHLAAMKWVAREHGRDSFIVLTRRTWANDGSAEWFPVLTGARSVNTVQGREWRSDEYMRYYDRDLSLKRRLKKLDCADLAARLAEYERPNWLWAETRQDCFRNRNFRPVFRNSAVTIYELGSQALSSGEGAKI